MHGTQNSGYHSYVGGVLTGKGQKIPARCQKCSVFNLGRGYVGTYVHVKNHWAMCLRSVFFKFLLNVCYIYSLIKKNFFKFSPAI